MKQIRKEDFFFSMGVEAAFIECPLAPRALLKEGCSGVCLVYSDISEISAAPGEEEAAYTDRGPCPLLRLRAGLDASPQFRNIYRGITEKIKPNAQRRKFLYHSSQRMAVLFSANQFQVPQVSEELVTRVIGSWKTDLEVEREFQRLFQECWQSFVSDARRDRVSRHTWRSTLLVLKIFLEAMEEPSAKEVATRLTEELFQS